MSNISISDGRSAEEHGKSFLPGMGRPWLLPLYDPFSRLVGVRKLHARAVAAAGIRDGERVLDVGCGTGNLTFAVLRATPGARVTATDPDDAALAIAARKARRRGVSVELVQAYADHLPAEDGSLDHVVSSLALHHVDDAGREGFAREALRVLRPGGRLTIVDFGGTSHGDGAGHGHDHRHGHARGHGLRRRAMQNTYVVRNLDGGLLSLLRSGGLDAHEVASFTHRVGDITIVQATR